MTKISSSVASRAAAKIFPKGGDYAMIEYKGYIGVVTGYLFLLNRKSA